MSNESDHDQHARTLTDTLVPGLSLTQRALIREATGRIVSTLAAADTDPIVAYTALLNVMANLIATRLGPEFTEQAVTLLPFYVQAYKVKEKKVDRT